jgi:hypothetical protein
MELRAGAGVFRWLVKVPMIIHNDFLSFSFDFFRFYWIIAAAAAVVVLARVGSEDALYKELWHACAGPLVTLPRQGELVYYFPQGHIEQVRFHLLPSPVILHPKFSLSLYFFFAYFLCNFLWCVS